MDYSARKRGLPTTPVAERIKLNVAVKPFTGCWEWKGSKKRGYGHTIIGSRVDGTRRNIAAHRLSYETFIGPIADGMEVCHRCDNPSCVNPEHLFLGTRQDNIDDREAKQRNNPPKGSSNGRAKLSEADVLSARFERSRKTPVFKSWLINTAFRRKQFKTPSREERGSVWHICRSRRRRGDA